MDYNKTQRSVTSKLGKYGLDLTVECTSAGTYGVAADSYVTTLTSYDVKGLFGTYNERDIDGTVIQVGDKRLLLQAEDLPQLDLIRKVIIFMEFIEDEDGYAILDEDGLRIYGDDSRNLNPVSIASVRPDKVTLMYKLHCRG